MRWWRFLFYSLQYNARTTSRDPSGASKQVKANDIPFPVVGVGASAGGLEAFTLLLQHLPVDTGMSFVLVQHLDPAHESALTKLLSKATSMLVVNNQQHTRATQSGPYYSAKHQS